MAELRARGVAERLKVSKKKDNKRQTTHRKTAPKGIVEFDKRCVAFESVDDCPLFIYELIIHGSQRVKLASLVVITQSYTRRDNQRIRKRSKKNIPM